MSTPITGSLWLDTRASVPHHVEQRVTPDDVLRRTVEVVDTGGRGATIIGRWQRKTTAGWETVMQRRTYCDLASFGRRYQPLTEERQ